MALIPVLRKEEKDNLTGADMLTKPSVEFYSKWMQSRYGSEDVTIMSPEFYADVSATMRGEIPRHAVISKYANQKISETDFAMIPIFDCDHWSLVIVSSKVEKSDPSAQAAFWFVDAAKGKHDKETILRYLKSYISDERFLAGRPPCRKVYTMELEVPSQYKGFDCGRYTLYFMQNFLRLMYNTRRYEISHIHKYLDCFQRIWFQESEALVFGLFIARNVFEYDAHHDIEMPLFDPNEILTDVEMTDINSVVTPPLYYNLPDDSDDIERDDDFNLESLLVTLNI